MLTRGREKLASSAPSPSFLGSPVPPEELANERHFSLDGADTHPQAPGRFGIQGLMDQALINICTFLGRFASDVK